MGEVTRRNALRMAGILLATVAMPRVLAASDAARHSTGRVEDHLRLGFVDPPMSARPRVWWHWMNGNVTREGITRDIEWMSRAGIGGMQNFDAALETPQIVDRRLSYMTAEWKDAFRHAAMLAESKGMELAVAASPGWSTTGGPWVRPEDGMKKLTWSEMEIPGGVAFTGFLPSLPAATGPFQDIATSGGGGFLSGPFPGEMPRHSADAAVIAYRLPSGSEALPSITCAGRAVDTRIITNASGDPILTMERSDSRPSVVELTYDAPTRIHAATIFETSGFVRPELEVAVGGRWQSVTELRLGTIPATTAFPPVSGRRFRVVLHPVPPPVQPADLWGTAKPGAISPLGKPIPTPPTIDLAQLRLWSEPRVHAAETKAGFEIVDDYSATELGDRTDPGVSPGDIVDLAGHIKADGRLEWTPPPGRWRILRFGYSLTGKFNHPATSEATGLEVDKYDRQAVRRYLETYLKMYADTTGPEFFGQRGLSAILVDSIEVGCSNWTRDILQQFSRLRGYDATPWLPVLTGAVVGTRGQSDAFLYDFRLTLSDLIATEHYATVAEVAHEHGLTVYGESQETTCC